jgi:hypothetical protein
MTLGRPYKNAPNESLVNLDKVERMTVVNAMVTLMCESIISELENPNSEVYQILDSFCDVKEYDITESDRDRIKKTYLREMEYVAIEARKLIIKTRNKKITGGRKKKEEL